MSLHNGLLLINKPAGITSHDVVDRVRRVMKTKEVGHSGTLDPLASGLLVLLIGKATKLSPYIMDGDKAYSVELQLGLRTDTLDVTGETLETFSVQTEHLKNLEPTAASLSGEFQWPVPLFSAVKVQGKKLHEVARSQQTVMPELPIKTMRFWNVVPKNFDSDLKTAWVDIECSKGSFIRTWVEELGKKLGCGAAMKNLVRTASSPYTLSQAITLEKLQELVENNQIETALVEMNEALPQCKKVRVQLFDQTLLLNGQLSHDLRRQLISVVDPQENSIIQVISNKTNELLALISFTKGEGFKIKRVLGNSPTN